MSLRCPRRGRSPCKERRAEVSASREGSSFGLVEVSPGEELLAKYSEMLLQHPLLHPPGTASPCPSVISKGALEEKDVALEGPGLRIVVKRGEEWILREPLVKGEIAKFP